MSVQEWNIKPRSRNCVVTGREFVEDEPVYSALFWESNEYHRMDVSVEGWEANRLTWKPVSLWQSPYKASPPPSEEPLKKDDVEGLLRRLVKENDPAQINSRYVLAAMLERKKILKPIDRKEIDGQMVLIYEHLPTAETWLVVDPQLKLQQLEQVQAEVVALLNARMQ